MPRFMSIAIICLVVFTWSAVAQIPRLLSYQGVLTDALGNPAPDGDTTFTFRLYETASGGTAIWGETKTLTLTRGLFSTMLGDVTAFGANVLFDEPYWLGIQVETDPELSPRIQLGSAAYSLRSVYADTADSTRIAGTIPDNAVTTSKIASSAVTPAKLNSGGASSGQALMFNGANVVWGNPSAGTVALPFSGSASNTTGAVLGVTNTATSGANYGLVGLSNSTLGSGVQGESPFRGVVGLSSSTSGYGVYGQAPTYGMYGFAIATSGTNYGVYGLSNSSAGYGVYGQAPIFGLYGFATANSGVNWGVYGESNSTGARGVFGFAGAASGATHGVSGVSASTSGIGAHGAAIATSGVTSGVYGQSSSTVGRGVYGIADATNDINFGVYGRSNSNFGFGVYGNGPAYGVRGDATATGIGSTYGVVGTSNSTVGYGVFGFAFATTGTNYGVFGTSMSTSGLGVYGIASTTSGMNYGVYGQTNSVSGRGVYGVAAATSGAADGVVGVTSSTTGYGVSGSSPHIGVFGFADAASGATYGVYGFTNSSTGNYAGYFGPNVHVVGTLSKGGGSFKIDHPLDPANKYLYHSFVESPDMMNIYNGNVTLDGSGEAWVQLSEWFGALNKDFRYQLTAVGAPGPNLYIASEIQNNRFQIAGGGPGMKVSWQVTGIRKDAFAEKNRIPVEEMKSPEERGYYMHPEVFGLSKEMAIPSNRQPSAAERPREIKHPEPKLPDISGIKNRE